MSKVVLKVPDFTDEDGIRYEDIEVVVTGEDLRTAAGLVGQMEKSSISLVPIKKEKRP